MRRNEGRYYTLKALPGILILALLFLIPLGFTLSYAFHNNGNALVEVFSDPYTYRLLAFTLEEALLSAVISTLVAIPLAALTATPKNRLIRILTPCVLNI